MPPAIPQIVRDALDVAKYAPVPGLAPAIDLLKACIDLYNTVQTNSGDCRDLLERVATLLKSVEEKKPVDGELQEGIESLVGCVNGG